MLVKPGVAVKYRGRRKQGKVVEVISRNGKKRIVRLHKSLPRGCKVAKRICVKCLVTVIHKLEKNYDLKICKQCLKVELIK